MNQQLDEQLFVIIDKIFIKIFLVQFIISIAGIIINIPHVFILTRSSMRTSSTNSLMIGISLCDVIFLSASLNDLTRKYWISDNICINVESYFFVLSQWIFDFLSDVSEKSSFSFGVILALIRLVIMKTSGRFENLAKPITGYLFSLMILILFTLASGIYYLQFYIQTSSIWKPPKKCTGYVAKHTEPIYSREIENSELPVTYFLISGVYRVSISILYPILALLLMYEVCKSAKFAAAKLSQKTALERYHSARMILVMTVSYFIAGAPGVLNFLTLFVDIEFGSILIILVTYAPVYMSALFCFNAMSHCLINFSMSSNYRSTVNEMWCFGKSKIVVTPATRSNIA